MARYWFGYRADLGLAIDNPSAYRQVTRSSVVSAGSNCFSGANICALYAVGTTGQVGSLPQAPFGSTLQQYITDSASNTGPFPISNPKYFLYKKA